MLKPSAVFCSVRQNHVFGIIVIFRLLILVYFFVGILFFRRSLPFPRILFLIIVFVLLAWNAVLVLLYQDDNLKALHASMIIADFILALTFLLLGGGWGDVYACYAASSIFMLDLEFGFLANMLGCLILSLAFLLTLWFPSRTLEAVKAKGAGIDSILIAVLASFIVGMVAAYIRTAGKRTEAVIEKASHSHAKAKILSQRASFISDLNELILLRLENAKARLVQARNLDSQMKLFSFLESMESSFRKMVTDSRAWLKWARNEDIDLESPQNEAFDNRNIKIQRSLLIRRFSRKSLPIDSAERMHEKAMLTGIFTFRYASLIVAFLLVAFGLSPSVRKGIDPYLLIGLVFFYNVCLMTFSIHRERPNRLLLICIDAAVTFFCLVLSGAWSTYFFMYIYGFLALASLWFGMLGAVAFAIELELMYLAALHIAGYGQRYLNQMHDLRFTGDTALDFLLVSLILFLLIDFNKKSVKSTEGLLKARSEESLLRERLSIARDMHDRIMPILAAISQKAAFLKEKISIEKRNGDKSREGLIDIDMMLDAAIAECGELVKEKTRPIEIADLIEAIKELKSAIETEMPLTVQLNNLLPQERLTSLVDEGIIAVVREVLFNVQKHSAATDVSIRLSEEECSLQILVKDNGRGFSVEETLRNAGEEGHFGLLGVEERINSMRGEMLIKSQLGEGTSIFLIYPLMRETADVGSGKEGAYGSYTSSSGR